MSYDPSVTQKVKTYSRDGSTDRHKLSELLWTAIENHDDAVNDYATRIRLLENSDQKRLTEEAVKVLIEKAMGSFKEDVKRVETLIWRVLVATALMIAGDIWMGRHPFH